MPTDAWARAAAALPQAARRERELPFFRALAATWGWRRVVDAGCGGGFHLGLLAVLGVGAVGVDLSLSALETAPRGLVVAGDVLAPPLPTGGFDAVLCLGNTVSLLPTRLTQRRAVAALARLLRPGGHLLVQGEDAGALVAAGPTVRTRPLPEGGVHVRVFEQRGRRVRMLAGVAPSSGEAVLTTSWLLPTSAATLARLAAPAGLRPAPFPAPPPAGSGWWVALVR